MTSVFLDTAMSIYVLYHLKRYIHSKRKARQQSPETLQDIRMLTCLIITSALLQWILTGLFGASIVIGLSPFALGIIAIGISIIPLHVICVCLNFKLIQGVVFQVTEKRPAVKKPAKQFEMADIPKSTQMEATILATKIDVLQ